jgi:O-antigen ligase
LLKPSSSGACVGRRLEVEGTASFDIYVYPREREADVSGDFTRPDFTRPDFIRPVTFALILAASALLFGAVTPLTLAIVPVLLTGLILLRRDFLSAVPWRLTGIFTLGVVAVAVIAAVQLALPGRLAGAPADIPTPQHVGPWRWFDRTQFLETLMFSASVLLAFALGLGFGKRRSSARTFLRAFVLISAALVLASFSLFVMEPDLLLLVKRTAYLGNYTHGFINRNTAASYLVLCVLVTLALLVRAAQQLEPLTTNGRGNAIEHLLRHVTLKMLPELLALGLFLQALGHTGSRAGMVLGIASVGLFFLIAFLKQFRARGAIRSLLILLVAVAVAAATAWLWQGGGRFAAEGFRSPERWPVYAALARMVADHPLFGIGLGAFPSVFPAYRPASIFTEWSWDRAHNTPLQLMIEGGIPFASVVLALWLFAGYTLAANVARHVERYALPLAGLCAWVSVSVHSLVDFPLQVHGNAICYAAIIGVALSGSTARPDSGKTNRALG